MSVSNNYFGFKQCISLLKSTGVKAKNLGELHKAIAAIPEDSIFHHTFQYFLKGHTQEYTNDFAHWAGESLEERTLAEELSNLDPYDFANLYDVRKALLSIIEKFLERFPEPRESLPGDEFYFNETVTIVFPAGITVKNLAEFLMAIKYVDSSSIYYHFYDARARLGEKTDDFSRWIGDSLGKTELAASIREIDPFMHATEGIRERITELIESEVRHEMEYSGGGL
jgi:Family of unknown function (DUF5752)